MDFSNKKYEGVKAFLIARVSDPSQREALPAQKYKLEDYSNRLKLDVEYYEFDESAFKEDREKFEKIVQKILKCPNECVIVFDKVDRLTRDCSSEIVNKLKKATKLGRIELHFASDGLVIRKDSPSTDWFRLDINMATAAYYSGAISDNVKRRNDQKLRDGEFPHKAPIGYKNVKLDNGKNEIIIDDLRAPFIREIFELRFEGMSLRDITTKMRESGLTSNMRNPKPITKAAIAYILTNKFYYGIMTHNGREYPHKYETYITKADYEELQAISDKNYTQKFHKKEPKYFTFKGILKCGVCGCSMSSYTQKGRVYMRCSNAKGKCPNNADELGVVAQIEPIMDGIKIDNDLANQICDEINQNNGQAKSIKEAKERALREEYAKLERRKDTMYEDRLDGRITMDKYDELVAEADRRMTEIDDELVRLESSSDMSEMTVSNLLELAKNASELFKSSKPAVKNQILRLMVSNLKIEQKRLQFNLLEPFSIILNEPSRLIWLPGLDSNQ